MNQLRIPRGSLIILTSITAVINFSVWVEPAFAKPPKASAAAKVEAPSCKSSVLIEQQSGEVLHAENADTPLAPASMAKIMLAYVVMNRIHGGSLKLTDAVSVSAECSKIGGSQVYLKQGETFSVGELLNAVMIQSANDASVALAEHIGGSRDGFVKIMNETAKGLGLRNTVFQSPHGLPPSAEQEADLISAHDLAMLTRRTITDYPEILQITSKVTEGFRDGTFTMSNHNHLLRKFPGCDGMKTGYYGEAGFGITATATRNGIRMITTVMGCNNRKKRDDEAARLLSEGLAQYRSVKLIDKQAAIDVSVQISGGEATSVPLVTADAFQGVVKIGEESKVSKTAETCGGLNAPVNTGTECGKLVFAVGERVLGSVPLLVAQDVQKGGITSKIRALLGR